MFIAGGMTRSVCGRFKLIFGKRTIFRFASCPTAVTNNS